MLIVLPGIKCVVFVRKKGYKDKKHSIVWCPRAPQEEKLDTIIEVYKNPDGNMEMVESIIGMIKLKTHL